MEMRDLDDVTQKSQMAMAWVIGNSGYRDCWSVDFDLGGEEHKVIAMPPTSRGE